MTLHIGAHMFIFNNVEDLPAKGPDILKALADAGYEGTEGAPGGFTSESKQLLDSLGLSLCGNHQVYAALEDTDTIINDLAIMSSSNALVSGLIEWESANPDIYRESCALLNKAGSILAENGIRLHYHNHAWEFEYIDGGRTGMDILLENLDNGSIGLCLDMGWADFGGCDVPAFMKEHGDRITYVHLRDFDGQAPCSLGRGDIDLAAHIKALQDLPKIDWVLVEQHPGENDPLHEMLESRNYLKAELGV